MTYLTDMLKHKKQQTTEEIYTVVVPVVFCADEAQVNQIMHLCGTPRALTYNKLGSIKGWGLDWKKADRIIRTLLKPSDIGLPAKLWEWSVNDCMKAINAQQEDAKSLISRAIWQRYPLTAIERQRSAWLEQNGKSRKDEALQLFPISESESERNRLFHLMHNDPTADSWLHRQFRSQFVRGHTYQRNQIVYQGAGYTCKRINRNTVELRVMGIVSRERLSLILKCRHIISGQIRLIRNEPIRGKQQAKRINRQLNQWMKGELQASLEKISLETGSTLSVVNPAYTSQVDSLTGTLLGSRSGDRFIRFTGDVIQADKNAALNILHRGWDSEITRYLKYAEVCQILIQRTVRYLASIGRSVSEALDLGWLHSKFKAEALRLEAELSPSGVDGTVKPCSGGRVAKTRHSSKKQQPLQEKPAILDTPMQLSLDFFESA